MLEHAGMLEHTGICLGQKHNWYQHSLVVTEGYDNKDPWQLVPRKTELILTWNSQYS